MYTIKSNGVRDEFVTTGAIEKTFDALSKRVGDTDFQVIINANKKEDFVLDYTCDIQSALMRDKKFYTSVTSPSLLTACKSAADNYQRRWEVQKAKWEKHRHEKHEKVIYPE